MTILSSVGYKLGNKVSYKIYQREFLQFYQVCSLDVYFSILILFHPAIFTFFTRIG